jgi:hypothetical protein
LLAALPPLVMAACPAWQVTRAWRARLLCQELPWLRRLWTAWTALLLLGPAGRAQQVQVQAWLLLLLLLLLVWGLLLLRGLRWQGQGQASRLVQGPAAQQLLV